MEKQETKVAFFDGRFWLFFKNSKVVTSALVFALIAFAGWYQFFGTPSDVFSSLKSNIISLVTSSSDEAGVSIDEKLSTGEHAISSAMSSDSTWEIRKSEKGESVWKVYAEMAGESSAFALKNQTINGLKNITLLQNNIPAEQIANRSLAGGKEYSFLSRSAAEKYAGKLAEAHAQIAEGAALKDLSTDLQTAYLVANAPSYAFLHSLSVDNITALYH